jgi:ATP phosphoribosyltransferase
MLTIALPKGALLDDSIRLLKSVGLDFSLFLDKANRQLQIADASGRAKGLLVRAQDVPVYVEYGQAQLGIVGYDVLREKTTGCCAPSRFRVWQLSHVGCGTGQQPLSVGVRFAHP